jgi:hypothetical protein
VRHLRKKLQQIEALEARAAGGEALNAQQAFKVAQRPQVCCDTSIVLVVIAACFLTCLSQSVSPTDSTLTCMLHCVPGGCGTGSTGSWGARFISGQPLGATNATAG